jgi:hypothetical protein
VTPADLLVLLREFYADKRAQRNRHEGSALVVGDYDFNNTYQYILNREDAHLAWLRDAIAACGGTAPEPAGRSLAPETGSAGAAAAATVLKDAQDTQALVERWQSRVDAVTNARHRQVLHVILGETREHQRFFEQAAAGRTDLLGRRTPGSAPTGGVLPTRWVE